MDERTSGPRGASGIGRILARVRGHARDLLGLLRWPIFAARHRDLAALIRRIRDRRLTYLSRPALADLAVAVRRSPDGAVIEAGAALGGSTILLAAAKRREQPLYVYDTFGMIPPPTEDDGADAHARFRTIARGRSRGIGSDEYYGYRDDLKKEVEENLRRFGFPPEEHRITLIQGQFQETLRVQEPVAVAHVDCDWYRSVLVCLDRIGPAVVEHGRIVIDDYDHWSGARRAVDEWLEGADTFGVRRRSRLHLVRLAREEPDRDDG